METPINFSSAAANVDGPLQSETGSGLLHIPDANVFALAAGADGRPSDSFSVRILTKALRIAFRPKDGSAAPATLAEKSQLVRNAIRAAGEAIATQPSERRTGGATLAVIAFDPTRPESALVLNVGNCRCYRFRNSRPECLTRSVAAADNANETPLLLDVLHNAIDGDDDPEIEEQTIAVQAGDVFVLLPGSIFGQKSDLAVGRALRRVPGKGADLMAASLVEEALKSENVAGIALVVKTEAAQPADTAKDEPVAEVEKIAASEVAETKEPAETDAGESATPDADETETEVAAAESDDESEVEPESEEEAEDSEDAHEVKTPEPSPYKLERGDDEPQVDKVSKRTPRKMISEEDTPVPSSVPPPEPVSKQAILAAAAATPSKPPHVRKLGPLSRSPLLHTETPPGGAKPLPLAEIAVVAGLILALVGGTWLAVHYWKQHKAKALMEQELTGGGTATAIVSKARISGEWGNVEKALKKLPPLATGDEDVAHAWIELWSAASAPDFSDVAARNRLDTLGALVERAGGPQRQPMAAWKSETRANEICRIAAERQRQLHAAIEGTLQLMNKRGDIPFADHTEQNEVLAGVGRFTHGRYATKLGAIAGDFTAARIAEGQLESVINLHKLDLPMDEVSMQRIVSEPLLQLNISLDRAWDGLLDVISGSATDSAQWRRATSKAATIQRLNRLDAIRQNILAERKRYGDVRRWRTSVQNKQLFLWLLDESAKLGVELSPPPATRRR